MNSGTYYNDILGRLRLWEDDGAVVRIEFANGDDNVAVPSGEVNHELLDYAYKQIDEYTKGKRMYFDFPIRVEGTEFQRNVWDALTKIPYGETKSYKELARMIGNPKAVRAVGGANNKNKLPIVIPCHRVIGVDGRLVGYAGGVDIKEKLLAIERNAIIRDL